VRAWLTGCCSPRGVKHERDSTDHWQDLTYGPVLVPEDHGSILQRSRAFLKSRRPFPTYTAEGAQSCVNKSVLRFQGFVSLSPFFQRLFSSSSRKVFKIFAMPSPWEWSNWLIACSATIIAGFVPAPVLNLAHRWADRHINDKGTFKGWFARKLVPRVAPPPLPCPVQGPLPEGCTCPQTRIMLREIATRR